MSDDPRRHRRLGVRALARRVLSQGAAAGARARACQPPAHHDRDQRHILPHADSRRASASGRDETPDDFVFSLKGPQFATNRRVLAEAGESIERFFASGVLELKSKLGPILWQMAPTKKFEPDDFAAFLALLPPRLDGRAIRHVVEVRHESFLTPAFIDLLRKFSVAAVAGRFRQASADRRRHQRFRLCPACSARRETVKTGYPPTALDTWAERAQSLGGWRRAGRSGDRSAARRPPKTEARCLHLHDLGRQGARAGGRDGADRAAEVRCRPISAVMPARADIQSSPMQRGRASTAGCRCAQVRRGFGPADPVHAAAMHRRSAWRSTACRYCPHLC